MRNCIIYLIGFVGVGKLTTAQEIIKQDPSFRLFDNHAANNLVFSLARKDGFTRLPNTIWTPIHQIRAILFDVMVNHAAPEFNFVLTNALQHDDEGDWRVYKAVQDMAARRSSLFLPVRLICSEEENARRIVSPDREIKLKQMSADGVSEWHNGDVLIPDCPHITIDISALPAHETAAKILAEAARIYG